MLDGVSVDHPVEIIPPVQISSPQVEHQEESCLAARAAYDIGSGATKTVGAIVDTCKVKIEEVFSKESYPVLYRQDLHQSANNEFSDLIQDLGLKTLNTAKTSIESDYQKIDPEASHGKIQHCAVATAAFRDASNGSSFAEKLSETLNFTVNIISQHEEGELAYLGTIAHLSEPTAAPIVWDIGGGSMQLTFKDTTGSFHIMGNEVAGQTFHALVMENIITEGAKTPHPMSEDQIQAAIDLAKSHLEFDSAATAVITKKISENTPVVAVGSLHNFSIQPWFNLATKSEGTSYTKEGLYQAIELLTNKSDTDISKLIPINEQFVKEQLTNLILVYALMDMMGIDKVQTAQTSNVQGLLLKGC